MKSIKISIAIILLAVVVKVALMQYQKKTIPQSEMVYVEEGTFSFGSNDMDIFEEKKSDPGVQLDLFLENERPVRTMHVKGFYIDKYEVRNKEYQLFCARRDHQVPPNWINDTYDDGKENYPVNNITWFDAAEYCRWVGKNLPTEIQWEKAAKGPDNYRYPWGMDFDKNKTNIDEGTTLPVGSKKEDMSHYGAMDMAGNVMEWTMSWYLPFPGSTEDSEDYGKTNRVLRGWSGADSGHFGFPDIFSRTSARHFYLPYGYGDDIGFRCVKEGAKSEKEEMRLSSVP